MILSPQEIKMIEREAEEAAKSKYPMREVYDTNLARCLAEEAIKKFADGHITGATAEREKAKELGIAAEQILHLHLCEQEGLSSGQPTPIQWMEAVDKLSEALKNYNQ